MDREYVWAPGGSSSGGGGGYVDELVCQFDRYGVPFYAIQDPNFNVVGITDAAGQVLSQYTYDPYGQVAYADHASTPAGFASFNRIGHQGLFFDRFDVEGMQVPGVPGSGGPTPAQVGAVTQRPALAPYAFTGIQNRHRTLLPAYGRFAQKDPNASGMVLGNTYAMHGSPAAAVVDTFNVRILFGDGANLFGYVRSNPVSRNDPSGLYMTWDQTLELGAEIFAKVFHTLDGYSADQSAMAEWALDWSLKDDLFDTEVEPQDDVESEWIEDESGDGPLDAVAVRRSVAGVVFRGFTTAGRLASGKMYESYYAARKAISASEHGRKLYQAHHVVEVRALRALRMSTNGPAVVLTRKQHQVITNRLRKELPYGTPIKTAEQVRKAYKNAYDGFPELLEQALKHLDGIN